MIKTTFDSEAIGRFIACGVFSAAIVYIPWNSITTNDKFPDIENYIANISLIASTLNSESGSLFASLFSEPAWQIVLLIIFLSDVEPTSALKLISTFCALCISTYTVKRTKNASILLLLWNPLIIDLVISQTRSALALSLCLIALQSESKVNRGIMAALATMTHSATFVGLIVYFAARATRSKPLSTKQTAAAIVTLLIATALSVGRTGILTLLGDRRVEYNVDTGSFLYVAFWFIFAIAVMRSSRKIHPEKATECFIATCMMSIPTLTNILDTNGARFLALGLPILLVAISGLPRGIRPSFYLALPPYQAVQFLYWMRN